MTSLSEDRLRTGGDPRTCAGYTALRDELNKLTHPARPDVNWAYAETLCLDLFDHNGVDLQTAAWYTLARAQLATLSGMNEGLTILERLITRQWSNLWPEAIHVRVKILSTLFRRLQQLLRMQTLSYTDLSTLIQAEKRLAAIGDTLQHLKLKQQTGLDALAQQLRHAIVRLENGADKHGDDVPLVVLPVATTAPAENISDSTARPEPATTNLAQPPRRRWRSFVAGMFTMLVVGSLVLWGASHIMDKPERQALMTSVAPLPAPLPIATLEQLQKSGRNDGKKWLAQAQSQLDSLSRLSPVWPLNYGSLLVRQAQHLWPERPETDALASRWQQQLNAIAAPTASLESWQQGMALLQSLANRLDGLDEKRGKYMTVSELKSQVFAITQAFNQTVPAEELLRQLAAQPASAPAPAALRAQTELHLKQLLARYALLNPPQDSRDVMP